MQAPNWTDLLQCSVCTNKFNSSTVVPISLCCGHTLCTRCLSKLKTRVCPYDKTAIQPNIETHPPNNALLQLLGDRAEVSSDLTSLSLPDVDLARYKSTVETIEELALFLQPLAEQGIQAAVSHLTRPMLKKLVTVVNCQILEPEGRVRALRAGKSIADRMVTELLVMHQNQQQISTLLWTAVRNRGCQFLGPVMQEDALKLILKVLESGRSLSRKNIVYYVVQQLQKEFPQASKTSVGHVVQLLYRASCFNVEKREDDSSLMQLKEEFRSYEALRREHDGQIIRMAMEAGLRISPEQWSTLLYGDHKHKSDMQSIIDKLIALGAASSGLSELIVAIGRSQDPYDLSEHIVPHLECLLKLDFSSEKGSEQELVSWEMFATSMVALLAILQGFSTFMQIQSGRYKTGLCPYLSKPGGCPKGGKCTYAHTEEERDSWREKHRRSSTKTPSSGSSSASGKPRTGELYQISSSGGGSGGNVKTTGLPQSSASSSSMHQLPGLAGGGRYSGEVAKVDPYSSLIYEQGGYATTHVREGGYASAVGAATEGYDGAAAHLYTQYAQGEQALLLQQVVSPPQSLLSQRPPPPPTAAAVQTPGPYTAPQPQLVSYTPAPLPQPTQHHHSGPITVSEWSGGQIVGYLPTNRVDPVADAYKKSLENGMAKMVVADERALYYQPPPPPPPQEILAPPPPHPHQQHQQQHQQQQQQLPGSALPKAESLRRIKESIKKQIDGPRPPPSSSSASSSSTPAPSAVADYPSPSLSTSSSAQNQPQATELWNTGDRLTPTTPDFDTPLSRDNSSPCFTSASPVAGFGEVAGGSQGSEGAAIQRKTSGYGAGGGDSRSSSRLTFSSDFDSVHACTSSMMPLSTNESSYRTTSPLTPSSSSAVPQVGSSSSSSAISSQTASTPPLAPPLATGSYTQSSSEYPHSTTPAFPSSSTLASTGLEHLSSYHSVAGGTPSAGGGTVTSASGSGVRPTAHSKEAELLDRIQRLEQELENKDKMIHEQQNQLKYSGPKNVYYQQEAGVFNPSANESPHHSGLQQQQHSYSQPVGLQQYSPHNSIQQFSTAYATGVTPVTPGPGSAHQTGGGGYYQSSNQQPSAGYTPHQWSGPISGTYISGSLNGNGPGSGQFHSHPQTPSLGSQTTPPHTGYLMPARPAEGGHIVVQRQLQPQGHITRSHIPPQVLSHHTSDDQLAVYLQQMEQEKAAAAAAHAVVASSLQGYAAAAATYHHPHPHHPHHHRTPVAAAGPPPPPSAAAGGGGGSGYHNSPSNAPRHQYYNYTF